LQDKNGNYKVVYGLKLNKIPKGDIKVIINGHGDSKGIGDRSIEEIAEHISIIDRATGEDSGVRKVSLEGESFFKGAGAIFSRRTFF
jgi:hypothetical protein